jgi:hypothetical protein
MDAVGGGCGGCRENTSIGCGSVARAPGGTGGVGFRPVDFPTDFVVWRY